MSDPEKNIMISKIVIRSKNQSCKCSCAEKLDILDETSSIPVMKVMYGSPIFLLVSSSPRPNAHVKGHVMTLVTICIVQAPLVAKNNLANKAGASQLLLSVSKFCVAPI